MTNQSLKTQNAAKKHPVASHERRHGVADEPQPSEGRLGFLLLDDLSRKPVDSLGVSPPPGIDTLGVDPVSEGLLATSNITRNNEVEDR